LEIWSRLGQASPFCQQRKIAQASQEKEKKKALMPTNSKYYPPNTNLPASKVRPLVIELIQRCGGFEQAARYSGLGRGTIRNIYEQQYGKVQNRTARLVILALYQKRKEDRRNGVSKNFTAAIIKQAKLEARALDDDFCG
jgi:hypothetical protein